MALTGPQTSIDLLKIVTGIFGAAFISFLVQFCLELVESKPMSSDKTLAKKNKTKQNKTKLKPLKKILLQFCLPQFIYYCIFSCHTSSNITLLRTL